MNKKYDLTDEHDKYMLYRYFVAWATSVGSSVSPLLEYANNEVYCELIRYKDYDSSTKSDERLYVDLRRGKGYTSELEKINRNDFNLTLTVNLKAVATKR